MQSLLDSKNINFKQKRKIIKANYESIYLVESNILNDTECVLKVTGSTLNIYTLTLKDNKLKCNCKDSFNCFINNLYCKHLCFVLIKVGKILDDEVFSRNVLTKEECIKIIQRLNVNCSNEPDIIFDCLIEKYRTKKSIQKFQKLEEDKIDIKDECPICYLELGNDNNILKCPECKNYLHEECVQKWLLYNKSCVFCRSEIWK
jgi:hypothetical protein